MTGFREAVENHDIDSVAEMLSDDVVFTSPVAFKPYAGKAITTAILRNVVQVFEDFHYTRQMIDGPLHAYVFEAKVDGLALEGCDFLTFDDDGKIAKFTVMVRPLRAAEALARRMGERFEAIVAEATAAMSGADA